MIDSHSKLLAIVAQFLSKCVESKKCKNIYDCQTIHRKLFPLRHLKEFVFPIINLLLYPNPENLDQSSSLHNSLHRVADVHYL